MIRRLIHVLPAVVLALVGAAPSSADAQQILEQVIVRVNGDIVTKTQFESRQVEALRERPEFARTPPTGSELEKVVAEVTPDLILDAVDELLLVQRARELGAVLNDTQFDQWVTSIRADNNLQDEAQFQEALRQMGLTMAQLRQQFERARLVNYVQQTEIASKISVTEEEARKFYEANRELFTTPSEITLREILIGVPTTEQGFNVAQDDEARAKAEDLRRRLLAGEPFPRLAGEYSTAPSRTNGGLLPTLTYNDLAPQLQATIDGMEVGDITEVRRTANGYQILKLEERTPSATRPFQDVRADVSRRLQEQKLSQETFDYLERLRAQANIVWRNDELKRAYEQALNDRRASLGAEPKTGGA